MPSVHHEIAEARQSLRAAGFSPEDAAIDAEVLARHALGWDRARLLADGREPAPGEFAERYAALIARRSTREPVAYITGTREFWGLEFAVTRDVLIPRPETELIVSAVCAHRPGRDCIRRIVDVGTGSGCLAVALAREFPAAHVTAIDLSERALALAATNAARHGVRNRVALVRGDLLDAVGGEADVIVSNPPYVPTGAELPPDVSGFEPTLALWAGADGLSVLSKLIPAARRRLGPAGVFVFEFGFGQEAAVKALVERSGWRRASIERDLQGVPRAAVLTM